MIRTLVGLALATVVVAGEARAQIDLSVLDRGKPVEQVDISAILDDGKVVVIGTTTSTGQVTIPSTTPAFREGERVYVYVKRCVDGEVEIILSRNPDDDPCADDDAQAGDDCDCDDPIGFFLWGDDSVTIDIGTNTVGPPGTESISEPREDHSFADIQIGPLFTYNWFYQLEDTVCGRPGVVSCEADNGVPGFGGYFDYRFGRSFGLSLEAHYAKLEAESTTEDGGRTSFDVNSWKFQAAGVYNVPLSPRVGWYFRSGYAVMYNEGDVSGDSESESRSETGSRLVLGSGLHWPIGEHWCVRGGADWTTGFDSEDSDTHAALIFGVGYRMDRN